MIFIRTHSPAIENALLVAIYMFQSLYLNNY